MVGVGGWLRKVKNEGAGKKLKRGKEKRQKNGEKCKKNASFLVKKRPYLPVYAWEKNAYQRWRGGGAGGMTETHNIYPSSRLH